MTPRIWGALGGLLVAGSLVAFGGCWGSEYNKVESLGDSGGQGGDGGPSGGGGSGAAGGGAGACEPFTGQAPGDCDPALLGADDNCCVQGRSCLGGSCGQGVCQPVRLGDSIEGEAIGIVLVGDLVVWSSGWGSRILSVPKAGGPVSVVTTDPQYTTALATDGQRVFWVEYEGTEVWSVDPAQGSSSAVLVGQSGTLGGWGRIDVHGDWVFWVAEDTSDPLVGSVWMGPKDGSAPTESTMVHDQGRPHGVAADDSHVYWTDMSDESGGLYRLPIADVLGGTAGSPELFGAEDSYPSDVVVADGQVYWIDGNSVFSKSTSGGPETHIGGSAGEGWGLALDQGYLYWSDEAQNNIYRARREGGGATIIAPADGPKGVAVDCDAVYFANYTEQDPDYVSKVAK